MAGVFIDKAWSAWSKNFIQRPGGFAISQTVRPGDHVVFYSIDRGFRNVADFATTTASWLKQGIHAHYICDGIDTTTATGRLRANILASVAQYYSDIISERTREALAIKRIREGSTNVKYPRRPKRLWMPSDIVSFAPNKAATELSGIIYRYERCSHISSYTSGLGLECQAEANARYAEHLAARHPGLVVYQKPFVDEAISAYKVQWQQRPSGRKLWEILKSGDHVIVYRLDRAWRQPGEAAQTVLELQKRGVCVHFVEDGFSTDNQTGLDQVNMLAMVASLESSMKSRRCKEVVQRCREQGRPTGEIPVHCKVVRFRNQKKLAIDKNKLIRLAMCWIMANYAECSKMAASDVLHAIYAWEHDIQPRPEAFRTWDSFEATVVTVYAKKFSELRQTLPAAMIEDAIQKALVKLSVEPPAEYRQLCKKIGWPLPIRHQAVYLELPQTPQLLAE